MKQLPGHYVLSRFYTHSGDPSFRKHAGDYNASCNICREGKSWLQKKRLFYYPTSNSFYCFNCVKGYSAYQYIAKSTGLSFEEIETEACNGDYSLDITERITSSVNSLKKEKPILPYDSINLYNGEQSSYYKNNTIIKSITKYIESRRLNTAINRCKTYFTSLTDYIHKDRLCIPYFDRNNHIVFYQTRSVDGSEPRYLNKMGYDKTVFNVDRIDPDLDCIFMFEGPLDAMFVKNGVSLAGLALTKIQEEQLKCFPLHDKIWVLDNPARDPSAKTKLFELLTAKQKVFRWPLGSPYKDFNEWAVKEGLDEIPYSFITENLYVC